MCGSCNRFCTNLHMLWSLFYVCVGAVQIVAGIFFVTSIPMYQLGVNICAGTWNILFGIAGGLISCFGDSLSIRHEILLYMTISILVVNTFNGVFCEWHFYMSDELHELTKDPSVATLIFYARVTTGICAAAMMIISFIDTQLTFCAIEINGSVDKKNNMKSKGSHEQVSDIEYIIPRPKTNSAPKPNKNAYNAYAQSWVFDAESTVTSTKSADRTYLKLDDMLEKSLEPPVKASSPKYYIKHDSIVTNGSVAGSDKTFVVTTTKPIVHIEEASDDSGSNVGDRQLGYMKSFSATPSPNVLSASSSQVSLVNNVPPVPPIYECLERLTEPSVYRSRLSTAISERRGGSGDDQCPSPGPCKSPGLVDRTPVGGGEKVQYASLMMELEAQFMAKKNRKSIMSPPLSDSVTVSDKSSQQDSSRCTTEPSSSDVEFSKELEAALQLIQDLESPNTAETPSDSVTKSSSNIRVNKSNVTGSDSGRAFVVWRHSDASESDEKTLSAVGSLVELTSPMTEIPVAPELLHSFKPGKKLATELTVSTDSQSTSGYSSPIHLLSKGHTPNLSNTSSINGSANDIGKPLACSITNTKTSAVISLYTPPSELILVPNTNTYTKRKSITLVNIHNTNNDLATIVREKLLDDTKNPYERYPSDNNIARYTIDGNLKSSTLASYYKNDRNRSYNDAKHGPNTSSLNRLSLPATTSGPLWNVKSLLRKKKASVPPQLPPELEGAIFKSESLAYLSDVELLARHERNKEIQRQIELRVQQQLGQIPTESHC